MKANELRNMTAGEIRLKIEGLKKELYNMRTEARAGRIEKPHRINEVRKDVARCETIIREKDIQAAKGQKDKSEKTNAK
ncbi:MAG: 50S ribosomal protein L29 [Candidatus Omnitrophota bacterium]